VLADGLAQAGGDVIQGGVPVGAQAADARVQQTAGLAHGFVQCRALHAQAAAIGRMLRNALHGHQVAVHYGGVHAAADAAVGAGGGDPLARRVVHAERPGAGVFEADSTQSTGAAACAVSTQKNAHALQSNTVGDIGRASIGGECEARTELGEVE
jgi:hypothetical protein